MRDLGLEHTEFHVVTGLAFTSVRAVTALAAGVLADRYAGCASWRPRWPPGAGAPPCPALQPALSRCSAWSAWPASAGDNDAGRDTTGN